MKNKYILRHFIVEISTINEWKWFIFLWFWFYDSLANSEYHTRQRAIKQDKKVYREDVKS